MPRGKSGEDAPRDVVRVPTDAFNECVVVAAVCVDQEIADELLPAISSDHFFARGHAAIWEALRRMQALGLYYDPATVSQMSGGDADVEYLEKLIAERSAVPPNLRHHVRMLYVDKRRVDATRGPVSQLLESLRDPTTPFEKLRAVAHQVGGAFDGVGTEAYLIRGSDLAAAHGPVLEERRTGRACYGYGIPGLDFYTEDDEQKGIVAGDPRMIPGASPGTITLLTAVSGSGKSTVAARMILAWARENRRVLVGAWESGEAPTLELLASLSLGMSRTDIKIGRFDKEDQRELLGEMERIGEHVTFFKLPFGRARAGEKNYNDRALDLVRQVVADSRCEVFVADLMRRAFKETDPDDEEQGLFRLQAMGKELDVHQVWLHQQRMKDVEQRPDKRPTREGVKGSSAWVEVPDAMLGVHLPALWKNVPNDKIEIDVLKQRDGLWPQAVEFDWVPEFAKITGGKTVDYSRPGDENAMDAMVQHSFGKKRGGW
jgi:replicative DNA helicase